MGITNLKFVHFSDNTFNAPYLHKFSVVVQIMQFVGAIWDKL